jgi:putative ABC transport system permease protein
MQTLWMCLEEKSVLTDASIRSMKQYIAKKFPTYSSDSQADILANSLHRHINDYLPLVDDLLKEQIRAELLQAAYEQNNFRIGMLDISKACVVALSSGKREMLEPLEQWLKQQRDDITSEQTADFIQTMQEKLGLLSINFNTEQIGHLADPEDKQAKWFNRVTINQVIKSNAAVILITLLLCSNSNMHRVLPNELQSFHSLSQNILLDEVISKPIIQRSDPHLMKNELTERYNYHEVPLESIRQWLKHKDSKLAEEPYLSAIVETAHHYNIHPFLLLAITGQEQGLVPNSNNKAAKIANNPFNVYHSWKEYNTDITDSSRIAAKTILTLVKGRPEAVHPLKWINRKYAEDTKWHIGVEAFFKQMLIQIPVSIDQS